MSRPGDSQPEIRPRHLRVFGLVAGALLGYAAFRGGARAAGSACLVLAAASVAAAALAPGLLAPFYRGYLRIGRVLGWVNTRILLGLVFYGLVTPMAAVLRLAGKDPMRRAAVPEAASYRIERGGRSGIHMKRQF